MGFSMLYLFEEKYRKRENLYGKFIWFITFYEGEVCQQIQRDRTFTGWKWFLY